MRVCVLLLLTLLRGGWGQDEARIDEFIERVMECAEVPGLSLTVLKDGQDFMVKGYGVRDLDSREPVTNGTLTLINSMSKAFAATTAATLVKNNSIGFDWNTPARDLIGDWFYLNDSLRTSHVNMRDLLAHRVGLQGHTHYLLTNHSEDDAIRRLQYLPFSEDFRDVYRYSNVMYGLAGYVIKAVDGRRWEDIAREKILSPLGMDDTTFIWDEERWDEMMYGHYEDDDGAVRRTSLEIPKTYFKHSFSAAGGIITSALDMRHWMHFQLNEGTAPSGEQILTPSEFQETHDPTNHVSINPLYSRPDDPVLYGTSQYALGWRETTYRDFLVSQHSGSLGGFVSLLTIVKDTGLAIYTGLNKTPDYNARNHIHMYIMDLLLGYEPWLENSTCSKILDLKKERASQRQRQTSVPAEPSHREEEDQGSSITHSITPGDLVLTGGTRLEDYVGVFGHYAYGNVSTFLNDTSGDLIFRFDDGPGWIWQMVQTTNTTFLARGTEPLWYDSFTVEFELDNDGVADALTVYYADDIPPRLEKNLDWNNPPPPPDLCL